MRNDKLNILVKQSNFNKDCNKIIDTIAPFITNKNKITKREIDKANTALLSAFGTYTTNDKQWPRYTVSHRQEYSSEIITIYCHDRYISMENYNTLYIPSDTRVIYMNDGKLSLDELNKWKYEPASYPTKTQIESSFKKYELLNTKIRELENKRSELPFNYYFK